MAALAAVSCLVTLAGGWSPAADALLTAISQGGAAALIFVAAGGFGELLLRKFWPKNIPAALRVTTACGFGLWVLSTAVLTVGSLAGGLLTPWVWWPVIAVGLVLAAAQLRGKDTSIRWPRRVHGRSLVWILVAAAGAIWIVGATRPPGLVGAGTDQYDVLAYHLQIPREYFQAGRITALTHNAYSFYPSGLETLYLLCMGLRGSAYDGMYAAKFVHGLFAMLAVVAVVGSLRDKDDYRGRFAGVLLATTPFVIFLSWLAMVELAQVAYLALAALWLRQWLTDRSARSALLVGAMAGAACATKYLAVGFVAGPIILAMGLSALLTTGRLRTLWHVAPALLAALLLFSPWLIRNAAATGNPVFPLATSVFGGGHWSAESQQRWSDGHAPEKRPPVPTPDNWQMPSQPTRMERFYYGFATNDYFGPMMKVLAAVALMLLVAWRSPTDPWDWALIAIAGSQLAVWAFATRGMPPRFIVPVIVPMVLLVAGCLQRLMPLRGNPFIKAPVGPDAKSWGAPAAVVTFILAAATNLYASYAMAGLCSRNIAQRIGATTNGWRGDLVSELWLTPLGLTPADRPLLVGEAAALYMPPGTIYATAFDANPLAQMLERGLRGPELLAELQSLSVTHVVVNWSEIVRLANTYGYPTVLSEPVLASYEDGLWSSKPTLPALDALTTLGVTKREFGQDDEPATQPADASADLVMPTVYAIPPANAPLLP